MEIVRTPPAPGAARQSAPAPASRTPDKAAQAEIRRAAARQNVSDALAKAILADSNIAPADQQKFNVSLDIHKDTGRVVAEIRNKSTGELVQKIPSETILRNAAMLERVIGTILDTPA